MAYASEQGQFVSKYWESGTISEHHFVTWGTAPATQFQGITATNQNPIGVIHKTTAKTDLLVPIQVAGIARCEVGTGGVTAGNMVKLVDSDGSVCDATPTYGTEYIVGMALETGSAGGFVDVILNILNP